VSIPVSQSLRGEGSLARILLVVGVLALLIPFCLFLGNLEPQKILATVFLAGAVVISSVAARSRFQHLALAGVFFPVAAGHALFSYFMAVPSMNAIWAGSGILEGFDEAYLVVSLGLFSASIAYAVGVRGSFSRLERWAADFRIDEQRFAATARFLLLVGIALVVAVCARIGYIPLFSDDPGTARYLTEDISSTFRVDEWLIARAVDLLMCTVPIVFLWFSWRRRWSDLLMSVMGCVVMLALLRRAALLGVFLVVPLVYSVRGEKIRKALIATVAGTLLCVYLLSQVAFFNALDPDNQDRVGAALGSALPEVRDLGWMLSSLNGKRLNGVTLVQPFIMIPSFMSDFSQRNSLREITTDVMGLEDSRQTGGLRLTLAGEGQLNLGYGGVILVCVIFGAFFAVVDVGFQAARARASGTVVYLWAMAVIWLAFWVYLAGTQAAAVVKMGVLIMGAMAFVSRQRTLVPSLNRVR
jgi:oligosaccharide repeat unit polymerase